LPATEDDQRVVTLGDLGQATVCPGAEDLDKGGRLVQGDADLPVMRDPRILDDGNAHIRPPV
jgi:hypothetical protein